LLIEQNREHLEKFISDLFEEIGFEAIDFDSVWNFANENSTLSEEEKTLFPDTAAMNGSVSFTVDFSKDPTMTSAAILDDIEEPSASIDDVKDDDQIFEGSHHLSVELDMINQLLIDGQEETTTDIDLAIKEEPNDTVMADPLKVKAEDIREIHSYSQQPLESQPQEAGENQENHDENLNKVQNGRVAKRQRKPVKRFVDSSDESEDDEVVPRKVQKRTRSKSNSTSINKNNNNGKTKLYEMKPFSDPDKERCRQNAINAKINRDRKKNERNAMQQQMSTLREENQELKKKNRKYRAKLTTFEARLQALESIIRSNNLDSLVKASDPEE